MERNGKRTHLGDINREIQTRNRTQGTPREIRKAYYLSANAEGFASALEKQDMVLARVTRGDTENKAAEWSTTDRYMQQYDIGDWVAVTERGYEYRLGPRTMGDSARGIAEFMKSLGGKDPLSLEAAHAEAKRRSLIPKVNRDEVIESMMTRWKTVYVPASDLPQHIQAQYDDPQSVMLPLRIEQPKDHPRNALPYGADMPHLRGDAKQVWWAYNTIKSPEDFQKSLESRGLALARATAEDVADSEAQFELSKRFGRYHPILREGEYLAVSGKGNIYRLNGNSLGHSDREIRAFMGQLAEKGLPSLREAKAAVEDKRQKEIAASSGQSLPGDRQNRGKAPVRTGRGTGRLAGMAFTFVANGFEAIFGRSISPEEWKPRRSDALARGKGCRTPRQEAPRRERKGPIGAARRSSGTISAKPFSLSCRP